MNNKNHTIKIVVFSLFAILIATSTELSAKCKGGARKCGGGGKAASKEKMEAQKELDQKKAMREAVDEYMEPIDTNKDNSISLKEFLIAAPSGGGKESFETADKNKDRYLSKTEIGEMIGADKKTDTTKKKK